MAPEFIKIKIYGTEVEIPVYQNMEKTLEIVNDINKRMEQLKNFYGFTMTQKFAIRIAYDLMVELMEEKEKFHTLEEQIEQAINELSNKIHKLANRIEENVNRGED